MHLAIALFLVLLAMPAGAHEGTAGDHLLLGLDSGILFGFVIGFLSGIASCILAQRQQRRRS